VSYQVANEVSASLGEFDLVCDYRSGCGRSEQGAVRAIVQKELECRLFMQRVRVSGKSCPRRCRDCQWVGELCRAFAPFCAKSG
jgi:hypothetical protein